MRTRILFALLIPALAIYGCSAGSVPTSPFTANVERTSDSHYLWGIWDVQVIPDNHGSAQLEFTPLREMGMHLNVVGLLESGGKPAIKLIPPVTLASSILDATVQLTHPYSNLKFTGFDVRGILIGHGSIGAFTDSMFYAGPDDMELMNADGQTRLWNPTEYTGKGYVDGKLGTPDVIANFTATLNGYKYFADGLTSDMPVAQMLKDKRGAFTAGSSNSRHYTIRLGNKGLEFQYAIDANWAKPTDPVQVPGSFDVTKANCPEPYHIDGTVGPGIWGGGGTANVTMDVYDWQKDVNKAYVEAPVLTDGAIQLSGPQDMGDFVRFTGELTNQKLPDGNTADVLFYARGTDSVSETVYTDYHLYHLPIVHMPTGGVSITIQDDAAYKTLGVKYNYGASDYDWANSNPAPVDYNSATGPWDFTTIPNDAQGTREAYAKDDPAVSSFSGSFNSAVTQIFATEWIINGTKDPVYQAEQEDIANNRVRLWGIDEQQYLKGAVPMSPPLDFPYPMDTSTHFHLNHKYTVIPIVLTFTLDFETWGIGQGVTFYPVSPGVNGWGWEAKPALLTRTVVAASTGGAAGQGALGKALLYEWIADDGTELGTVGSGNDTTNPPNFDETTFQITGTGSGTVLRSIG